jgi:hypothetical protein
MTEKVQIAISREVYEGLQLLMVPPHSDVNAVIAALLFQDGRYTPAAHAVAASEQHYTLAQEFERASQGVYECGGGT